jgi:hypothetical protein
MRRPAAAPSSVDDCGEILDLALYGVGVSTGAVAAPPAIDGEHREVVVEQRHESS